jgi:hypothetical protein
MLIGVTTIGDTVNTARYFETAAIGCGHGVRRLTSLKSADALADLDLLVVVDPFLESPAVLRAAQCPVVGVLIDVHQQLPVRISYARYFDYVFVAQPDYLPCFNVLAHPSVHWLPLGCDPDIHFVPGLERNIDVGFVGKLGYHGTERRRMLESVLSHFETNDCQRFYSPEEMGEVYSSSKIVFNKSINGDVNMRFFEALASGALLVTDRVTNGLSEIATEGLHFVGYNTAEEAQEKVAYYLSHERERIAIALAGQAHVFAHHTYAHRLQSILTAVSATVTAKAPARMATRRTEIAWRSECYRFVGAPLSVAASLLGEGGWSKKSVTNIAVAAARGIVRPLRQRLRGL